MHFSGWEGYRDRCRVHAAGWHLPGVSNIIPCARCCRNCYSQRPVDALILMAWCGCLCVDCLFGVCLLGQVQINLLPQLIGKKQIIEASYIALGADFAE